MEKDNRTRQEASKGDLILEIKRLRKEYGQMRDESYEKIDSLKDRLDEENRLLNGCIKDCEDTIEQLEQQLKEANDLLSQYSDKTMGNITFPEFDNVRVEMIRKYGKYLSKYGVI
jgi:dynactin complex subunit